VLDLVGLNWVRAWRSRTWWCVVCCSLCLLLGLPDVAWAQAAGPSAREPAGYRTAIRSAIEEYELNHFTESRELFARAHALFPNARTLRGLGVADFELRRYVDAVRFLELALASNVKALEGSLRQETEVLLTRAQGYVGTLHLRLEPADAAVAVDGLTLTPTANGELLLEVGDHVLECSRTGYVSARRAFQIHGGQTEELVVQLASVQPTASAKAPRGPLATPREDHDDTPSKATPVYKRWWLWTVVGLVVAGAAAGTAVALAPRHTRYEPATTANTPEGVSLQPLGSR
jgi:hypothetical protein